MPKDLKEIKGVEIFAAGTWNGDTYTVEDLDEMVKGFNELSSTLKPYLKLGHDDQQKLVQKDGFPAAGWVGNLYRKGEKLLADFIDIPEKIFQLIENKAYRKVSSEIFCDVEFEGKQFKRLLSGVALLGANTPAVSNLNDILSMYGFSDFETIKNYAKEKNDFKVNVYSFDKDLGDEMSEKEQKLEQELKDAQAKIEELQEKANFSKEQESELAKLKEFQKDAEEKIAKLDSERREAQVDKFVTELEAQKLSSASMREYVRALVGDEKKEYSFGEKKFSKQDLLKETLKLAFELAKVNFNETTTEGDESSKDQLLEKKIRDYAKENSVSYSVAYREVMKEEN